MNCQSGKFFLSDIPWLSHLDRLDKGTVPDAYDTEKATNFRELATSTMYTV